jgi:hypothetical protein
MRVRSLLTLVATVAGASISGACARPHPASNLTPEQSPSGGPVVLEVENHNWSDINIYVLHDSRRHRLTTVTAATDLSIELPLAYQGETGVFRLVIYRIGGRDSFTTEPISIRTGYTVRLTVESDLQRTSVGVW